MKSVVLTSVAALALLALPAMAQTETDPKLNLTPPAIEEEQRTAPDTGSIAPGSGLTLSGEVVSWNDQQLVVKTTTGIEHIVLDQKTSRPATFTPGEQVVVDYVRTSSNGVMIAQQVRLQGVAGTAATTATVGTPGGNTTDTTTMGETQLEKDVEEAVEEVEEELDEVTTEVETDTTAAALPATGSNAPLVGLLGLLALGAAAGLRRL